jgi:hypothetical protein
MPVARSQADIMCLAVYTLTSRRLNQGHRRPIVSNDSSMPVSAHAGLSQQCT